MTERQAVEIDYCPACRGVWLDRAELDKIIERSLGSTAQQATPQPQQEGYRDAPQLERRSDDYEYRGKTKKKRGGWLEDFFDFD